ncbi:MAG: sodium ion-translocating decarboxylase subunit beta [Candidatus Cloacimonadales bacterium]|jgi:oxaloacetate decarboxylase beta subunit|nr:sodium ion-translocating decarboxylase subunit beta [Candidatus Cloacimonadota bacterium]MCB5264195.1 sodium ion-translocating decarboxylase subunit beta [Candidatus Cloacimonadota bacterium]MCB5277528.1 sodium ion-translocating decarboxylase subunit beta [Candidatus Cloacimonadota bacterium]MCK9434849.1 sodium ion-translocating decarboxylase subunit beta [Candidatus Cloacimonadota bacterium]MDY0381724.1 sodium ion-translocating decarboxylase subunit beta [Candidatus Cloacimonadaceae bacteri
MQELLQFIQTTGFMNVELGNIIMIAAGLLFVYLGISKEFEPLLLVPIGFGMIVGNIPGVAEQSLGVESEGSVLSYLYFGVSKGIYPSLIFLGVGAMTDFTALIANPRLILLGAAAQFGIFATFMGSLLLGFTILESASIGIIGGADGPTSIFLASKMAPHLLGSIALAAYSYMALVPVIQPPIMRLLTTPKERVIRMKALRVVSKKEKMFFPIVAFIVTSFIAPGSVVLLAMLFLGNLLKESGVTDRLANSAKTVLIDVVTVLIGLTVGAKTTANVFLTPDTIKIFLLGAASFCVATAAGVIFAKILNLFSKNKINPLVGAAGVSAVPASARVVQVVGQQYDRSNYLVMHAMAPNVAGVVGSAVAAGVLLGIFGS